MASNRDVLIAWKGLGYNSRALRLRDAAKMIVTTFHGKFPHDPVHLQSISGIGHYTAGAIRNFAFGLPTACIDTNIRRILHRCFFGMENRDGTFRKTDKELLPLLEDVMAEAMRQRFTAQDFYAALMDFGSLVCTKNNPKWQLMPLRMRPIFKAYGKQIKRAPVADLSKGSVQGKKREPGREVAGKFIPNRIFRGRVIDALRGEKRGLTLEEIGKRITLDWSFGDHREWLSVLLEKLKKDELIEVERGQYLLHQ